MSLKCIIRIHKINRNFVLFLFFIYQLLLQLLLKFNSLMCFAVAFLSAVHFFNLVSDCLEDSHADYSLNCNVFFCFALICGLNDLQSDFLKFVAYGIWKDILTCICYSFAVFTSKIREKSWLAHALLWFVRWDRMILMIITVYLHVFM